MCNSNGRVSSTIELCNAERTPAIYSADYARGIKPNRRTHAHSGIDKDRVYKISLGDYMDSRGPTPLACSSRPLYGGRDTKPNVRKLACGSMRSLSVGFDLRHDRILTWSNTKSEYLGLESKIHVFTRQRIFNDLPIKIASKGKFMKKGKKFAMGVAHDQTTEM